MAGQPPAGSAPDTNEPASSPAARDGSAQQQSSQLAFRSRIGGRTRRSSVGSSASSSSGAASSPPSSRILSGRGGSNLRRRQSSLSSQLSSVTTFASDEDSEQDVEELEALSFGDVSEVPDSPRRAQHSSTESGHRRSEHAAPDADSPTSAPLSSSFPTRRISTTPLFPSPLAQALSAHMDDIEPLEIESDGAAEADDEEDEGSSAQHRPPDFLYRMVNKSPVLRGGSPLRRELAPIPAPLDAGPSRTSPIALPEPVGYSTSVPSFVSEERPTGRRASQATVMPSSASRGRSTSADPSASALDTRRQASGNMPASMAALWSSPVAGSPSQGSPEAAFDSPKIGTRSSSSPTSSRRSSVSVFSGSPSSPRITTTGFSATGSPSMTAPAAPPESIKLQRVPSAVRIAQALQPSASSAGPSSPVAPLLDLPRRSGNVISPTPTPAASRASSSRGDTTPAAPSPIAGPLSAPVAPPALLQRANTTMGHADSAFSPLFTFDAGDRTRRERSRTTDPTDVFSISSHSTQGDPSANEDVDGVSRSARTYGVSPLSRGISPLALAGTGGRAFSVHAPSPAHSTMTVTTPKASKAHVRRSLAPPSPFTAADGAPTTDEYARIIMQSRTAKMQKWRADGGDQGSPTVVGGKTSRGEDTDSGETASIRHTDSSASSNPPLEAIRRMQSSGGREIEWVDWLEEYRKMKEAKVMADLEGETAQFGALDAEGPPLSPHSISPLPSATPMALETGREPPPPTPQETRSNPFESASQAGSPQRKQHSPSNERRMPLSTLPEDSTAVNNTVEGSSSSPSGVKFRRRTQGGFARIDAWWSAVRSSFTAQPDEPRATGLAASRPGRIPPPPLNTSTSRRPPLRTRGSREEMPPPPVPLRVSQSAPSEAKTNSPTVQSFSGALAPAATIDTQPRRSLTTMTALPQRPRPTASTSFPLGSSVTRKPEPTRRNPHLSLRLDGTTGADFGSGGELGSSSGSSGRGWAEGSASRRPGHISIEPTPALTPGHSPAWTKTPSILPVSQASASGAPLAPSSVAASATDRGNSAFSMPAIKQHIRHRLNFAKESCDRELRKISAGITSHVEQEMRLERLLGADDTGTATSATFQAKTTGDSSPWSSAMASDVETGAESDAAGAEDDHGSRRPALLTAASAEHISSSTNPSMLQRRSSLALSRGRSHTGDGAKSPRRKSDVHKKRLSNQMPPRPSELAAALRTSVGKAHSSSSTAVSESNASSRSTSRSRSPLPGSSASRTVIVGQKPTDHLRPSSGPSTPSEPSYMSTLQAITAIATEILDTSVTMLTVEPSKCSELVQRVQNIGRAWDEHPDWPCRGWYVQLLLAVAGLSRVVEWWEAEKGFWNFDEEEGDSQDLIFVAKAGGHDDKPAKARRSDASTRTSPTQTMPPMLPSSGSPARGSPPLNISLAPRRSPEASSIKTSKSAGDLAAAVEQVKSVTILMELELVEQRFEHLSPVWIDVVGLDPEDCLGQPISEVLLPSDAGVFAEATRQLLADDSHTVEVFFRLRIWDEEPEDGEDMEEPPPKYQSMDGKGMLMRSRQTGEPTHTMWVVRPRLGSPQLGETGEDVQYDAQLAMVVASVHKDALRSEAVLCRICERDFPAWFFEKHCETCNETHRLDRRIGECNEHLNELRSAVRHLLSALGQSGPTSPALEYNGIAILGGPSSSSTPSPPHTPEGVRRPSSPKPHQLVVRRLQMRVLEQLLDIIQSTLDISTPALPEQIEGAEKPPQRTLSPTSESNAELARRWQKPVIEDPALARLAGDAEEHIRSKLATINRLQNALVYADRIRAEWQDAVTEALLERQRDAQLDDVTADLTSLTIGSNTNTLALAGLGLDGEDGRQIGLGEAELPATSSQGPAVVPRTDRTSHGLAPDSALGLPDAELALSRQRSASVSSPLMQSSPLGASVPLSPRLSAQPAKRAKPSSIKDFEVIKPISKGAFGSVYLAKKKATGDYYAIKVLKKSDMIAKNQVTNVKAERMILMTQSDSDFVVKLFYTFQSRDYLYLVMEYLNGGDCAALVKALGCLEEEWTQSYIAEVVLGLEYLHQKGVVHRDLKPDNLLIDSKGHLKLTDFGLSKIGLLGRQARGPGLLSQPSMSGDTFLDSRSVSPSSDHAPQQQQGHRQSYFFPFTSGQGSGTFGGSESSASGSAGAHARSPLASPFASTALSVGTGQPSSQQSRLSGDHKGRHVVGSPDYIAPESILGFGTGVGVDWWALGVICYEFLYGIPPFHAETPERVFENILSRRISWEDAPVDISDEARDFMEKLLVIEPANRLGSKGTAEVKAHPFLASVEWDTLRSGDAAFVPQATDPESTDYFDARGATQLGFEDQELMPLETAPVEQKPSQHSPTARPSSRKRSSRGESNASSSPQAEDFGAFDYKNLDVLKQANDDVIRKLRSDQMPPMEATLDGQSGQSSTRTSPLSKRASLAGPPISYSSSFTKDVTRLATSPSELSSSQPARGYSGSESSFGGHHERQVSEMPVAVSRVLSRGSGSQSELGTHNRRNSLPTRLRTASFSSSSAPSFTASESWKRRRGSKDHDDTPASSMGSPAAAPASLEPSPTATSSPTIDVLVAEDNPISSKVIEVLLTRLGCRVVVVQDGEEAIRSTMGALKFDVIFLDIAMPVLDGEDTARMIRSTQNVNQNTPIVAVTSYESEQLSEAGTVFSGVMTKPVTRTSCIQQLQKLGFAVTNKSGSSAHSRP